MSVAELGVSSDAVIYINDHGSSIAPGLGALIAGDDLDGNAVRERVEEPAPGAPLPTSSFAVASTGRISFTT